MASTMKHEDPTLDVTALLVEPDSSNESGQIVLSNKQHISYRPIRPGDREALQRFHRRLSDQTVYFRFFGPLRELSTARATYFTHLDGLYRFALVAVDPNQPDELIAVARFDREPGTERAEIAVVIADEWQGLGLGITLTKQLIDAARRRGITSIYAIMLPENRRMINLMRNLKLPQRGKWIDGTERIEVDIADHSLPLGT